MSDSNPINYQFKVNQHSEVSEDGELGVCVEQIDIKAVDTSNVAANTDAMEMDKKDVDDGSNDNGLFSRMSYFVMRKKTYIIAVVAVVMSAAAIIGLSGIIGHNRAQLQQQKAIAPITGSSHGGSKSSKSYSGGSKSSKSSPFCSTNDHNPIDNEVEFCEEDNAIECGDTFTNESVVLSHDLFCMDDLSLASDEERKALNAAITLTGPSASIDCKGHSIRQILHQQFATACPVGLIGADDPFAPSDDRKGKKEYCGFYYQAGILLVDGATAVNCKVENFHDGFLVLNGGEVQKSESLGNNHGVVIQDLAGSTESMVTDLYSHDNTLGIVVNNYATSTAAIIEDTASKFNSLVGFILYGPDVTVKDSTASYNGDGGFYVQDTYDQNFTNTAKFEGTVSSHHNLRMGFVIGTAVIDFANSIEVIVKGRVNAYLNEFEGLQVENNGNLSHNVLFAVEDGGLFSSCQNNGTDIVSKYGVVNFNDEGGAGYTCDTSAEVFGAQGLPICVPCPACT